MTLQPTQPPLSVTFWLRIGRIQCQNVTLRG